jgi:signal transduction histidine kinase
VEYPFPHRTAEAFADLGRFLAQTLDRSLVARRIADGARLLLDAQAAWVFRLDADGGAPTVLGAAGDQGLLGVGAVLAESEGPVALAARECRPVATADFLADERIAVAAEARRTLADGVARAILAIPMVAPGRVIGVLVIGDRAGRSFTAEETRLAQAFADQAAVAFENARLYEEAERRRHQAEAAERRSTFLAEASRVLASSLDWETTLAQVARLVVPGLADLCTVDVLDEHGGLRRLAAAYIDPANVDDSIDLGAHGLANVLRTGQSEFHAQVTDEVLDAIATDAEHRAALRALGLRSIMVVPLNARGRRLGAITLCSAESGRRYGSPDLAFAEDLAGRAAQAIDNARLYRAAQEASRAKDEFLATVSHELRTPLTAIVGWTRVLRSQPPDPAILGDALETIDRNARAQAQIINDLLDVSRIITGMLRLNVRPIDLVAVIAEAVAALRPAIDAKALELVTDLHPTAAPFVGDPDRLQQVVWNLLSNAVKFTPAGGRIVLELARVKGQAQIRVIDSGQGIAAEFLPYVFDRFRQAESISSRSHSGLGLGLAIVRHIVELHGGTVRAESAGGGQGATFVIDMPVPAALQAPPTVDPSRGRRQRDDRFVRRRGATGAAPRVPPRARLRHRDAGRGRLRADSPDPGRGG